MRGVRSRANGLEDKLWMENWGGGVGKGEVLKLGFIVDLVSSCHVFASGIRHFRGNFDAPVCIQNGFMTRGYFLWKG